MRKKAFMRRVALLVSLLMLMTSTIQTTYGFLVVVTDPVINTFKPEAVLSGDLTITKTVQHKLGEGYMVPVDDEFEFEVSLGEEYKNSGVHIAGCVDPGRYVADENGVLKGIKLKAGQTAAIYGELDDGTVVTVKEIVAADSPYTPQGGVDTKAVTITPAGAAIEFVNIYDPGSVPNVRIPVTVEKVMEYLHDGVTFDPSGRFQFVLKNVETGDEVSLMVGDDSKAVFWLEYTEAHANQQYNYVLTETDGGIADVEYDTTVHTFTVDVIAPAVAGQAPTVKVDSQDGVASYSAVFTNKYNGTEDVGPVTPEGTVKVIVDKTVDNLGSETIGPEGFRILLEDITEAVNPHQPLMQGPLTEDGESALPQPEQPEGTEPEQGEGTQAPAQGEGQQPAEPQQPADPEQGEGTQPPAEPQQPEGTEPPAEPEAGQQPTEPEQGEGQQPPVEPQQLEGTEPEGTQPAAEPEQPAVPAAVEPGEESETPAAEPVPAVLGWNDGQEGQEGETTPPEGETTPPEGETTPPEGETTPPEGEATPPEGETTPPEGETTPPEGETTPPAGETTPLANPMETPFTREAAYREVRYTSEAGKAVFELNYTADDVGTHEYKLTEVNDGRAYVGYDSSEYIFTVTVSLDGEGKLVTAIDGAPGNVYNASFVNTYNYTPAPGPGPGPGPDPVLPEPEVPDFDLVPIIVLKNVVETGDVKLTKEGYEFVLDNLTTGQKMVRTSDDKGQANFFLAFYEHEIGKTYQFKLTETAPEGAVSGIFDNVLYDATVYDIQVEVVRKGGVTKAVVTINGEENTDGFKKLSFTNVELSGVEDVTLSVKAHKTVKNTGDEKLGPEDFKILLKRVDESGEMIGKPMSARTSKKGNVTFKLPAYELEDVGQTFRYQIWEEDEGKQNVTYDETVHEFAVQVRLTDDYKLEADLLLPMSVAEKYAKDTENDELKAALKELKELKTEEAESENAEIQWVDMTEFGWKAEFTNTFHWVKKSDIPKTGDDSHVDFWFTMMLISLFTTIALLIAERRSYKAYKPKHY